MVRRKQSRGLGGSRVYKWAIRGRQNGNPGFDPVGNRNLKAAGYVVIKQGTVDREEA